MELSKKSYFAFIPAQIWAGIIVFMSLLPSNKIPIDVLIVSDKIIHGLIYFVLALFLVLAYLYTSSSIVDNTYFKKAYFKTVIISLVLGILLEIAQDKMGIGRSGDYKDVIANSFGIVIVYPFVVIMQRIEIFNTIFNFKQV